MSKNCKTVSSSSLGNRVACNADLFEDSLWVNSEAATIERHMPVPPSLRVLYPADLSEVVSAVEDLWLRIRRQLGVRIHVVLDTATGVNLLLLRADRANLGKEGQDLLEAAEDMDRYRWLQSPDETSYAKHQALCLASEMTWLGDTLVIELMPLTQLARHAGTDGLLLVQTMLGRLRIQSWPRSRAWHVHQRSVHD